MRILITGAGGFLGSLLAQELIAQQAIWLDGQKRQIDELVLSDMVRSPEYIWGHGTLNAGGLRVTEVVCDCSDRDAVTKLLQASNNNGYDVVFHLAAVVSAQAEDDFALGYRANVVATLNILNGLKQNSEAEAKGPLRVTRFFMTSSLAVFGRDLPPVIPDSFACMPLSSYGTQKAICELYTLDYSRKGYCDGRILRLPTVIVRPGKPNAAASSFASSIIREPLQNEAAVCPVPLESALWVISPKITIHSILHMVGLPQQQIAAHRVIHPIGLTVRVEQLLDALEQIAGAKVRSLVRCRSDPRIEAIVLSWPSRFRSELARKLGFPANQSFQEFIDEFLQTVKK